MNQEPEPQASRPREPQQGPQAVPESDPATRIVLWGPSAAGKTMLLAQLYLQSIHFDNDWKIHPSPQAEGFIQDMMKTIQHENSFPIATPVDHRDEVTYRFFNPSTQRAASLTIEDRSGKHYEEMGPDTRRNLAEADGLVLLFDPLRDKEALQGEVTRTLQSVYFARGKDQPLDERPYAVCLSKADTKVRSLEDLHQAHSDPQGFVLQRIRPELVQWIGKFCTNYRLFPVSSVGVRLTPNRLEPTVFFDERLQARFCSGAQPLNLIEPFAWLISRLEGAP